MKHFYILLLIFTILSCKNDTSDAEKTTDLFKVSYSDYKDVTLLKDYKKVSDTAYSLVGYENTHRITQLEKDGANLILFAKVSMEQDEHKEVYKVLDTLKINNLRENHKITIGYCEVEGVLMEETIAVVEKTDRDTHQKMVRAWKANDKTNKIEAIETSEILYCFNDR